MPFGADPALLSVAVGRTAGQACRRRRKTTPNWATLLSVRVQSLAEVEMPEICSRKHGRARSEQYCPGLSSLPGFVLTLLQRWVVLHSQVDAVPSHRGRLERSENI